MQCWGWCYPVLRSSTFAMNEAPEGSGIWLGHFAGVRPTNVIIAYGLGGRAVHVSGGAYAILTCCNIFGNEGGDYVGLIERDYGVNGNFSACPSFCHAEMGDFRLCDESPCLPGNHPDGYDCGLIGAWGEGCICGPTQTEPTTWGAIKAMYK